MFNLQFLGLDGHFFGSGLAQIILDYLCWPLSYDCGQMEGLLEAGCVRQNSKVIP